MTRHYAKRAFQIVMILLLTAVLISPASAAIINKQLDPNNFGMLDQADTECPLTNCGPTAATNSFVFLQNMYPDIYGEALVPSAGAQPTNAELIAVANDIGNNFMKNCAGGSCGGTLIEDFILGKMEYIESKVPGKTVYNAQMNFAWRESPAGGAHPGTAKPDFVQDNTKPTLAFLAMEIMSGEDVELFVGHDHRAHYLTLTGIMYDDTTNVGTFSYIDPLGGVAGTSNVLGLSNGFISTDYQTSTFVYHAVSESPIPEPATIVLLALGGLMLASRRRQTW